MASTTNTDGRQLKDEFDIDELQDFVGEDMDLGGESELPKKRGPGAARSRTAQLKRAQQQEKERQMVQIVYSCYTCKKDYMKHDEVRLNPEVRRSLQHLLTLLRSSLPTP